MEDELKDNIAARIIPKREPFVEPDNEHFVKQSLSAEGPTIDVVVETSEGVEVEVVKKPQEGLKAKRFIELVAGGTSKWEAAKAMNTTVRDLMKSPDIRESVRLLNEQASLPNAVRKQTVRNVLNKIMIQNAGGDIKEQKLALAAAKEIARDPDVGLNTPATMVGVSINMEQMSNLMKNLKPIEGFEDILEVKGDEKV